MLAGERSSLFKAYKAGRPARLIRTVRPTTIRLVPRARDFLNEIGLWRGKKNWQ